MFAFQYPTSKKFGGFEKQFLYKNIMGCCVWKCKKICKDICRYNFPNRQQNFGV